MEKNWIVTAWVNPMEMKTLHLVGGATHEQVVAYAKQLWDTYGEELFAVSIDLIGNMERHSLDADSSAEVCSVELIGVNQHHSKEV